MIRLRALLFLMLSAASLAAAQPAPPANSAPLAPPDYIRELEQWNGVVEAVEAGKPDAMPSLESLPPQWRVQWRTQQVAVDTEWLRRGIENISRNEKQAKATRERLRARLQALREEAQALQAEAEAVDLAHARQSLNHILSRREFAGVSGPDWWDELRWRISQWIQELLAWLFGRVARVPYAGEILLWLIIAVLVSVVAVWLVRLWRSSTPEWALETESAAPPARDWSELARLAVAAAERGDYRQALHWAYWATVYRLENLGVWTVDRSRTPREYLRLLPPQDARQPVLAAVTRRVESVWYGGQSATRKDFHEVVIRVESLGCLFPWSPETGRS
ncbi:MAG TPA: DUF4129 domain-containing protein [Candidatus Xenobia bacterium]|nr:DUF4129 domain-containing protein [Candidatus Xenobia bacterium]